MGASCFTVKPDPVYVQEETSGKRYRAIFSYQKLYPDDLEFRKNDHLIVTNHNSDMWYYGKNLRTRKHGAIPSNYVTLEDENPEHLDGWFDIDRKDAELKLLLEGKPPGCYIIRPCRGELNASSSGYANTSTSGYAISVRYFSEEIGASAVAHYRILQSKNKMVYYLGDSPLFSFVSDLITHFTTHPLTKNLLLTIPCPKYYVPPVSFHDFEVAPSSIVFTKRIAEGHFGTVYLAKFVNRLDVAVKVPKHEGYAEFIEEARRMHTLRHKRIVQLLAVCTKQNNCVYIIMEYIVNGSLKKYLKEKEANNLVFPALLRILSQIAEGMEYLASCGVIHCDLRADNVLVDQEAGMHISDFGLSLKSFDHIQKDDSFDIPVKWAAPEVISRRAFSEKSDVFSFSILMYEILTYGKEPYESFQLSEVHEKVLSGYRMPKPDFEFVIGKYQSSLTLIPNGNINSYEESSAALYNVMCECWKSDPEDRPTFRTLNADFSNRYLFLTDSNYL